MALEDFAYNPVDGLKNAVAFPTDPANEAAARKQIQDVFDQVLTHINTKLVAILKSTASGSSGSENIGSPTIAGITGNTVYAQIASLLAVAQAAQAGTILPGTVTDVKLSDDPADIKARFSTHEADIATAHETLQTIASATGTVNLDMSVANSFDATLTGATTFAFLNPPATGNVFAFTLFVNQGATAQTITWPASVKWGNDSIPDLSAINKTSILVFVTKDGGTTRWNGAMVNNKYTT